MLPRATGPLSSTGFTEIHVRSPHVDSQNLVADVLVQVSDEIDAALVIATHDAAISDRMCSVWPMHDGALRAATPLAAVDYGEEESA